MCSAQPQAGVPPKKASTVVPPAVAKEQRQMEMNFAGQVSVIDQANGADDEQVRARRGWFGQVGVDAETGALRWIGDLLDPNLSSTNPRRVFRRLQVNEGLEPWPMTAEPRGAGTRKRCHSDLPVKRWSFAIMISFRVSCGSGAIIRMAVQVLQSWILPS